jgi:hypothetical protein
VSARACGLALAVASGCGRSGTFGDVATIGDAGTTGEGESCPVLGHWPLDVRPGDTLAPDAGPLGHDGAIRGAVPVELGRFGGALHFAGNDDVAVSSPGLRPETSVSMTAWVRPSALGETIWHSVVGTGSTSDTLDRYWLGYYAQGVRVHFSDGVEDFSLLDASRYTAHIGTWHHLAATFDGATRTMEIYVDGELTARADNGPERIGYDDAPLRIGADTNWGMPGLGFHGDIDEVEVFACALDPDEVALDVATGWPFERD